MKKTLILVGILFLILLSIASCADSDAFKNLGKELSESTSQNDTNEESSNPLHQHSWKGWVEVQGASCVNNGLRQRSCSGCNQIQKETIYATGHQYSDWTTISEGTCLTAGKKIRTCTFCNKQEQADIVVGHTYVDNTCTGCGTLKASSGLVFTSNGDGTCLVSGKGTCTDSHLVIPSHSPRGDKVIGVKGGTSKLGDGVFANCDYIVRVTFPDTTTTIGEEAFYNCDGLTSIHIPANVIDLSSSAFLECSKLATLTVDKANTVYHSENDCIIKTQSKMLVVGAINSIIPGDGSVTSIGYSAFYGRGIKNIVIPEGITTIGYMSFYGCTDLQKIVLPDSVTGIQPYAFCYCYNLTSVTVGSGLEYIHSDAFSSCDKLVEVINHSNLNIVAGSSANEKIAYYALFVHNGETRITNWHNYLFCTSSGKNYLIGYVGENTTLNLPTSYNGQGYEIYKYAFYNNKNIVEVNIPETVQGIEKYAFGGCGALTDVYYSGTDIRWNSMVSNNSNVGLSVATIHFASGHTHVEVVDAAVAATCTTTGLTQGKHCLVCNEILVEQTVLPMVDHTYGEWHVVPANACAGGEYSVRICTVCFNVEYSEGYEGVLHPHDFEMKLNAPTCTVSGDIQIVCKNCGLIGAQEILSSLGHDLHWVATENGHYLACQRNNCEYKTTPEAHTMADVSLCVDATCTVCGYFMREGIGHIWDDEYKHDEMGHWIECTRENCNQTTSYGIHRHEGAICTDTSANCDICGKAFVPNGSHGMGEWTQTKAPSCIASGEMRRDCEYCDYYETKIIDGTGHSMGAWYTTQAPTETENGIERRDCQVCDYFETRTVAATGHHFENWYVTKEPTCTESGEKRRDCTHCDYYETRTVSELGHTCSNWIQTKAPTCTEYGSSYGYCSRCGEYMTREDRPLDHAWSGFLNDSTHHWKVCTRCGVQTSRTAHSGGRNTCTEAAKCSACEYVYGQAMGHDYETEYSVSNNTHYYSCKNGCGIKKDESVHKLIAKSETLETTDDGAQVKYTHKLYMECEVCGYQKVVSTIVGSEHYGVKILDAVEPTCTQTGLTWGWACAVSGCSDVYQAQIVIPALGHNYVNGVCTRCGDGNVGFLPPPILDDPSDPETHTCVGMAWITITEPTCTEEGKKHFICGCGNTLETGTISAFGHTEAVDSAVEPTCTETGLTAGKHCSVCDEVLVKQTVIPANGHTESEWIVDFDKTCTTNGSRHIECTVCEAIIKTESILAEHNYVRNICTVCGDERINEGLLFTSNGNKTCYFSGMGACTDIDIVIPEKSPSGDTVIGISENALKNCSNLISVVLPSTIQSIGAYAFAGCSGLTTLEIPSTVTSIGKQAFSECSKLESISLPIVDDINFIDMFNHYNFSGIHGYGVPESLKTVTITAGTRLKDDEFSYCRGIEHINLPATITNISSSAFSGCSDLKTLTMEDGNPVYEIKNNCLIDISRKTLLLGFSSSVIPDDGSVTSIGDFAFQGRKGLISIHIPSCITEIGQNAFSQCTDLKEIIIPEGIEIIRYDAFYSCSSLIKVELPSSLRIIENTAFGFCYNLETISIPSSVIAIGVNAFLGCDQLIQTINGVSYVGNWVVGCDTSVTSVSISNNIVGLCNGAFNSCTSLSKIIFASDSQLKYVGTWAFNNCPNLKEITIPSSVTTIGEEAFRYCSSLETVTFEDNSQLMVLSNKMFYGCDGLTNVSFGNNSHLTTIGESAFERCDALVTVNFGSNSKLISIGNNAFYSCDDLTAIVLDNNNQLTTIGDSAFYMCWALKTVDLGNGSNLTFIGNQAFYGCINLESVTIGGNGTTVIGVSAFDECPKLVKITFNSTMAVWHSINKGNYWDGYTGDYTIYCTDGIIKKDGTQCHVEVIIPAVDPTCTTTGLSEGKYCSLCNRILVEQEIVDVLAHTEVIDVAVAPTCTETGLTEGNHCSVCNEVLIEQTVVAALGHDEINHEAKDPTCTEIGWDAYVTCSRCDYTTYVEKSALGHDEINHEAKEPTCIEIGWDAYVTCSRCDYSTYRELEITTTHKVLSVVEQQSNIQLYTVKNDSSYPFSTSGGMITSTNKSNSSSSTYTITAKCAFTLELQYKVSSENNYDWLIINHNSTQKIKVSGTSTTSWRSLSISMQEGDTVKIIYQKDSSQSSGSDCGYVKLLTEATQTTTTTVEQLVDATEDKLATLQSTCTEDICCELCSEVLIKKLGHNYINHNAKVPTCTQIGWDAYVTCSRCDHSTYVEKTALGHDEIDHEAKAPTCTEIGWDTYATCSRCDYTTYVEKIALGHDEVDHEAKPNCTETGWDAYVTCSRCDYTTYVEKLAIGHDEINHEAKVPTCTEIGWNAYVTCSRCNYTTYVEKAELGHDEINHEAKAPTCTEIGWNEYVTCSRCYYTTYVEKSALGHNEINHGGKAATCTENGYKAYITCSRCSYYAYSGILYKVDHKFTSEVCSLCNAPISNYLKFVSNGNGTCYISGVDSTVSGHIDIPSIAPNGDRVISIGDAAFGSNSKITSVTIADSVESVGVGAFIWCPNLSKVTIGSSVKEIGYRAFYGNNIVSVTFKNCSGWFVSESGHVYIYATDILASDLNNTSTAAKLIGSTYSLYWWTRK